MNISDILVRQAEELGDKPCIYLENTSWTYRELDQNTWLIADMLHQNGVKSGSVVVHSLQNDMEELVAMMATARIGATVFSVPLNTPPDKQKALLEAVDAKFLVTDVPGTGDKGLTTIQVMLKRGEEIPEPSDTKIRRAKPRAPWTIVSGSGSTGKSKLMPITHRQQWERMQVGLSWLPYEKEDIFASMIRLYFYASKQRYLEVFTKGASIALGSFDKLNFHDTTRPGRVSVLYGTVFHVEQILASLPKGTTGYLESLSALMIGGSTVTPLLRKKICRELCSKLYILYGANECHTTCKTNLEEVYDIPGNVGHPHKGFQLQVVGSDDKPLPPGKAGNIRIKNKATISGYLHDEEATAKAFRNGWFYPGDLGRLTEDGQLIHLGRTDDLMIMNGINIYPVEIEQTLVAHPNVHDAAAIPLKHEIHQDVPICAVMLKKNAAVTEQELLDFARQRLGAHAPFRVVVLDTIPRNEQGKPVRADLQRLIAARMERGTALKKTSGEILRQGPNQVMGKQLQKRFSFSFIMPEKPDIAALDLWLDKVLGNDLKTDEEVNFPGGNDV
ncbi:MAG: acyl--CoA ligase, partial [Chlorobiales bacterium]|nr:acyl--CoA ligase [Chlorobiales bacterium]